METIQLPLGDVVELLNSNGFYVSRLATPGQIEKVIDLLKPWNTGHELIRLGSDGDGGYQYVNDSKLGKPQPHMSSFTSEIKRVVSILYSIRSLTLSQCRLTSAGVI